MSTSANAELVHALKVAFCYMPKAIDVNRYDHGDRVDQILADIEVVRVALLAQGVDPEEVYGEMNPDRVGPSSL
jgi:hypothetical protein